jgi:hypothetical protein
MSYQAGALDSDGRGKAERRRYSKSMIHNYTEYSGQDRRTGMDRRDKNRKAVSISATAEMLEHY